MNAALHALAGGSHYAAARTLLGLGADTSDLAALRLAALRSPSTMPLYASLQDECRHVNSSQTVGASPP